jgi:hypothetical protein
LLWLETKMWTVFGWKLKCGRYVDPTTFLRKPWTFLNLAQTKMWTVLI